MKILQVIAVLALLVFGAAQDFSLATAVNFDARINLPPGSMRMDEPTCEWLVGNIGATPGDYQCYAVDGPAGAVLEYVTFSMRAADYLLTNENSQPNYVAQVWNGFPDAAQGAALIFYRFADEQATFMAFKAVAQPWCEETPAACP